MSGEKMLRFPDNFLWGTAVCSHQSEGHNVHSDWWEFEQRGKIKDGSVSGPACDIWNRYIEDFDFMQRVGYTAFRMSVEWARIEPRPGDWDADALAHYADMLRALKERGIAVCLTLYHGVLPKWVADAGGWASRDIARWFREYTRHVVDALFDAVDLWITLNEPTCVILFGYVLGMSPPEKKNPLLAMRVFKNLLRAHAAAAGVIRGRANEKGAAQPPQIGVSMALSDVEPVNPANPLEAKLTDIIWFLNNNAFLDAMATGRVPFPFGFNETIRGLAGSFTFIGANYYSRVRIAPKPKLRWPMELTDLLYLPPGTETTELGWEIYAPGFHKVLMDMSHRYKVPIYVTENGIADGTDTKRPQYILTHLAQMHRAIRDGADIRGYFHWTFIDNFEWLEGWRPKFGLLAMDPVTRDRIPRRSATLYSEIARANAIPADV